MKNDLEKERKKKWGGEKERAKGVSIKQIISPLHVRGRFASEICPP